MSATSNIDSDKCGEKVDPKLYRGVIGSLLYLIASRPNIGFVAGLCAFF